MLFEISDFKAACRNPSSVPFLIGGGAETGSSAHLYFCKFLFKGWGDAGTVGKRTDAVDTSVFFLFCIPRDSFTFQTVFTSADSLKSSLSVGSFPR